MICFLPGEEKPLFKQGLRSLSDLRCGSTATGKVTNVTHFGAFVDIGVGIDGLIHTSKMSALWNNPNSNRHGIGEPATAPPPPRRNLELGNRVEVLVESVEKVKKRISLKLVKLLWKRVPLFVCFRVIFVRGKSMVCFCWADIVKQLGVLFVVCIVTSLLQDDWVKTYYSRYEMYVDIFCDRINHFPQQELNNARFILVCDNGWFRILSESITSTGYC